MLAWTKALIKLRRCTIAPNDGSMQHLVVSTDDVRRTLVMQREEVRVVANLGDEPFPFDLLEGEQLRLVSQDGLTPLENQLELPAMSVAVLTSTTEQSEDREVR